MLLQGRMALRHLQDCSNDAVRCQGGLGDLTVVADGGRLLGICGIHRDQNDTSVRIFKCTGEDLVCMPRGSDPDSAFLNKLGKMTDIIIDGCVYQLPGGVVQ